MTTKRIRLDQNVFLVEYNGNIIGSFYYPDWNTEILLGHKGLILLCKYLGEDNVDNQMLSFAILGNNEIYRFNGRREQLHNIYASRLKAIAI